MSHKSYFAFEYVLWQSDQIVNKKKRVIIKVVVNFILSSLKWKVLHCGMPQSAKCVLCTANLQMQQVIQIYACKIQIYVYYFASYYSIYSRNCKVCVCEIVSVCVVLLLQIRAVNPSVLLSHLCYFPQLLSLFKHYAITPQDICTQPPVLFNCICTP